MLKGKKQAKKDRKKNALAAEQVVKVEEPPKAELDRLPPFVRDEPSEAEISGVHR